MRRPALPGLSLFWRTFFLLALLLAGSVLAWVQTLQALDIQEGAMRAARQAAGLVSLSRAALSQTDGVERVERLRALEARSAVAMRMRTPADRWLPYEEDRYTRLVAEELRKVLGDDAVVARSVNGESGLWVAFAIDSDLYWLQAGPTRDGMPGRGAWFVWTSMVLLATLLGSVAIARLINQPLQQLSFAASRIREGDLDSRLDENTLTSEIREVNRGFNRMARELARVEEDRAVMLAGISHDLRTPLARLRLETEMSVHDEDAKINMAMDIDQLDAIIDKFMDYARPGEAVLRPVHVAQLIDREAQPFRTPGEIRIANRVPVELQVLADETELGRVFGNLFENARRYGRGTYSGLAEVTITHQTTGPWAILSVRDQGPGVPPERLPQLTTPFFRGDAARTAATGAGLGLAIVDKSMHRMGGTLELANAPEGGLVAHLRLKRSM